MTKQGPLQRQSELLVVDLARSKRKRAEMRLLIFFRVCRYVRIARCISVKLNTREFLVKYVDKSQPPLKLGNNKGHFTLSACS